MDNTIGRQSPYETLVRYVPKNKLQSILSSVQGSQSGFMEALKVGDWHRIDSIENFIGHALLALKQGKISVGQFATTSLYWSAKQCHKEVEVIRLFNGDIPHRQGMLMMFKTLRILPTPAIQQEGLYGSIWLTDAQVRNFAAKLRLLPKSEQCFFVFKDCQGGVPSPKNSSPSLALGLFGKRTISQAVRQDAGFNVFNCLDGGKRMLPSFGMMQTYVDTVGGSRAVKIEPVLGEVPVEHLVKDGERGTRVMSIPYPGFPLPTTADDATVPYDYDFTWHDFYHAQIASWVPLAHRQAFASVARVICTFKAKAEEELDRQFYQEWFERLIDMEHPTYLMYQLKSTQLFVAERAPSDLFWEALHDSVFWAFARMNIRALRRKGLEGLESSKLRKATADGIEHIQRLVAERKLPRKVLERIIQQSTLSRYKIKSQHLKERGSRLVRSGEYRDLQRNPKRRAQIDEINLFLFGSQILEALKR